MSMQNNTKLKKLLAIWPVHTALPVMWLKKRDFSKSLIQKYISSNWMQYIERGLVSRPNDLIEWSGLLWGLQEFYPFHIGGKTALEMQGKSHFIKLKESEIYIFSPVGMKLPKYVLCNTMNFNFINIHTNLFESTFGINKYDFGEYSLPISNPARAFCEYVYSIENHHSYEEAYYIMENLQNLNPDLMQETLQMCSSIRVKRLVLCLAKLQNVSWYNNLDRSKIDLGTGNRQAVKGGIFDSEFLITYPKSWKKDDDEIIF